MKKILLDRQHRLSSHTKGLLRMLCLMMMGAWLMALAAAPVLAAAEEHLKQANNPLANMKSLQLQDFYSAKLYDMPDQSANTAWFRFVAPTGRILWRASLPLSTVPTAEETVSGLGDFNAFAAYLFNSGGQSFGLGPLVVAPTASDDALGAGKWQAGAAVVYFNGNSPQFQLGGLVTWQTSFAGDEDREDTNLLVLQPLTFWQLGKGAYLRGSPVWSFNLEDNTYSVPFGLGIGKVLKVGNIVYNLFFEPQYTLLHDGVGQPEFQIFTGVNVQFLGKKKEE